MREAQKNRGITATGNRCRPFCGLYVGRGVLTPPRGVGDAAPYSGKPRTSPLWQTPAVACGQAALRIVRKELPDLRGVGDAAPYSGEPQTFPLWQTPAAACGQAALRIAREELPDPRGVGDAAPYSGKS